MSVEAFSVKRPVPVPRSIIGYHGCTRDTAETILSENRFIPSTNTYDWLGEGIYFWEYAPYRALDWATALCERRGGEPAVIGVTVRLGKCLNLLDTQHSNELVHAYRVLETRFAGRTLPRNSNSGAYALDCAVIDAYYVLSLEQQKYRIQTVRGSYPEGSPVYPGSKIMSLAHTQIAVRDAACIMGIHLVQFA